MDDTVQTTTGETVIRSSWASEKLEVDFSDPSMAMLNPNHAYGTVKDCIGYVEKLVSASTSSRISAARD